MILAGAATPDQTVMECVGCGARSPLAAQWCGQCFTRFDAEPELSPAARSRLATVRPGVVSAPAHFSRWRGGVGSFSLPVKLLITAIVLAVAGWLVAVAAVDPIGAIIWCAIIAPWILRDLWRRRRIR